MWCDCETDGISSFLSCNQGSALLRGMDISVWQGQLQVLMTSHNQIGIWSWSFVCVYTAEGRGVLPLCSQQGPLALLYRFLSPSPATRIPTVSHVDWIKGLPTPGST